ncbi:MAG TPA: DUF3617 family protein [Sphingomicrobium sp.]
MKRWLILAVATALPGAALVAAKPPALAQATPGQWEISGVPGEKAPLVQCIADVAALTQFEHRGRSCTRSTISDDGTSTIVQYSCGAAGFGRSEVEVITPRSLKISTQGISESSPFNYVLQVRRLGDCPAKSPSPPRH